jgi:hypothetical protein
LHMFLYMCVYMQIERNLIVIERVNEQYAARDAYRNQRVQEMTSFVLAIFSPLSFIVGAHRACKHSPTAASAFGGFSMRGIRRPRLESRWPGLYGMNFHGQCEEGSDDPTHRTNLTAVVQCKGAYTYTHAWHASAVRARHPTPAVTCDRTRVQAGCPSCTGSTATCTSG